ncbi:MAG: 4-hydroxy-tetrahydrodipicolinate reductase [Leptospiraceae bacterium]|nr:4-hydroxy-tetrahydrodipicolinate reductase [Leptospiraceae bacterium]
MSSPCRLLLSGARGRMGQEIIQLALSGFQGAEGTGFTLGGAIDQSATTLELVGQSIAVQSTTALDSLASQSDVVIDFSAPANTLAVLAVCRQYRLPCVIGTTGFDSAELTRIRDFARDIAILHAPNMSVGVNLLFELTGLAASVLQDGYDIEVLEAHHRFKKDAPSGTALRIKEVLLQSLERSEEQVIYGRKGLTGERPAREIGMHTMRGGDVVGDHTVFFLGEGERLEITHRASSRQTFASGALRAAAFLRQRAGQPGMYAMRDILGLNRLG